LLDRQVRETELCRGQRGVVGDRIDGFAVGGEVAELTVPQGPDVVGRGTESVSVSTTQLRPMVWCSWYAVSRTTGSASVNV
jgi:hypothetical protein